MFENLTALWPNYQAHGVTHLVLARVLEDVADLERYRLAVPGAEITVCRLVVSHQEALDRIRTRMPPGPARNWHLKRTGQLAAELAQRGHEDFTVNNGKLQPREVALEVLRRAHW